MLWTLDGLAVTYPYFEREEPLVEDDGGTYVETDVSFQHNVTHSWNHGIGETVTALLDQGMVITGLTEHDSVPWDALPGLTELLPTGEYRLREQPWRVAASYTLQAVKPR